MKKSVPQAGVPLSLFDPRRGDPSFKVEPLTRAILQPQRFNYFTVISIQEGSGLFFIDLQKYDVSAPVLLFVNPYQTFFLEAISPRGTILQFHANFFCIETYHQEVGCNGVLFNDVYGQPLVQLEPGQGSEFENLIQQMRTEFETAGLAHSEILLSYLKVFLIKASRSKLEQQKCFPIVSEPQKPSIVEQLSGLIEIHYPTKHSPSDYAAMLHITSKALGKLVKTHFGTTLTVLIRERILKHAKWQLLHTRKPVKEIASEIGFSDELYFSRIFKRATGCSPSAFREFETAIRRGSNLSM